jgi:hypothetical protein
VFQEIQQDPIAKSSKPRKMWGAGQLACALLYSAVDGLLICVYLPWTIIVAVELVSGTLSIAYRRETASGAQQQQGSRKPRKMWTPISSTTVGLVQVPLLLPDNFQTIFIHISNGFEGLQLLLGSNLGPRKGLLQC